MKYTQGILELTGQVLLRLRLYKEAEQDFRYGLQNAKDVATAVLNRRTKYYAIATLLRRCHEEGRSWQAYPVSAGDQLALDSDAIALLQDHMDYAGTVHLIARALCNDDTEAVKNALDAAADRIDPILVELCKEVLRRATNGMKQ